MVEIWRPVVGYEGYFVSNLGNIKRDRKPVRQHVFPLGYMRAFMTNESGRKHVSVHGAVLAAFEGPMPTGQGCRHLNGIRYDNRLENLTWGTVTENAGDRILHGTTPKMNRKWTVEFHADLSRIKGIFDKRYEDQLAQMTPLSIIDLVYYDPESPTGLAWSKDIWSRAQKSLKAGSLSGRGFYQVLHKRKNYPNHRLVWQLFKGPIPVGARIQHINGIKTDNRIENLRMVNHG